MAMTMLADAPDRLAAERLIARLDASNAPIDDVAIDTALGLRVEIVEAGFNTLTLLDRYGVQRFAKGDLCYQAVRAFYRALQPELRRARPPRLLDLGSGYGRFGLYGALRHGVTLHGIELVAERAVEAARAARALGLESLSYEAGDVLAAPWPTADVYLMMNAVLPDLLAPVLARLEVEARRRRIIVASISTSNQGFAQAEWLRELDIVVEGWEPRELRIWESIQAPYATAEH